MASETIGGSNKNGSYHSILEKIAGRLLVVVAFLLPVFFIPSVSVPFQFSKTLFFSLAVLITFCLWIGARLKDGQFRVPSSALFYALGGVVLMSALAALFSGSITLSFLGQGSEVGTAVNIVLGALLVFLVSVMLGSRERIFGVYLAFLTSFFLIVLFHVLRLILGPDFLALGIFTDQVSNTVGKWNDLGIFFGAATLLSLVTIEFLSLKGIFRALMYVALAASLSFLTIINFSTVWIVLALFSLVFLVYLISLGAPVRPMDAGSAGVDTSDISAPRKIPVPSLAVLLISVVFMLAGGAIGNSLSSRLGISQVEVRPSFGATLEVARATLRSNPLLGAGPNRFLKQWLSHKPEGVNRTIFWNTDFVYGFGLIPTFLVTTGLLGILAWGVFLLLFLLAGFRAILARLSDKFSQYLIVSSFLVSLFLWVLTIWYLPSLAIVALTFLFTGLFIAALVSEGLVMLKSVSFGNDPRSGFVSVLALILLLIGSVTLGYGLTQKYAAAVLFQNGVSAYSTSGSIVEAEKHIGRAAALGREDVYYRFLSELALQRMNALLGQSPGTVSADAVRGEFQSLLGSALSNAREAIAINGENYQNFLQLGRVYEAVVPLGISGAYESAQGAYGEALGLNPRSPAVHLTFARLEMARRDSAKAREHIAEALREKGNYTEAIFFLSQLEASEGNIKAAISSAEAAATLAPDDPVVFFQLGLLRFNDRNFADARTALEKATALNPSYANAKYFLGLSYERLGRDGDAIRQFEDLKVTNPDNAEVNLILRNLKAGRSPFSEAAPPIDDKPEKRSRLPVGEE